MSGVTVLADSGIRIRMVDDLSRRRREPPWISSVAVMTQLLLGVAGLLALAQPGVSAQGRGNPAPDVVSVKPSTAQGEAWSSRRLANAIVMSNMTLRQIIADAYGIDFQRQRYQLVGPDTLLDRRFDIQATFPDGMPLDQTPDLVKSLLADRFTLRTHREKRQMPVYRLSVARAGLLGPELRRSVHNCLELRAQLRREQTPLSEATRPRDAKGRPLCWREAGDPPRPRRSIVALNAGSLDALITDIQGFLDRPAVDLTGMSGNYEWNLVVALPEREEAGASSLDAIFAAFEEQLGLRLEAGRSAADVLVIDAVTLPAPN